MQLTNRIFPSNCRAFTFQQKNEEEKKQKKPYLHDFSANFPPEEINVLSAAEKITFMESGIFVINFLIRVYRRKISLFFYTRWREKVWKNLQTYVLIWQINPKRFYLFIKVEFYFFQNCRWRFVFENDKNCKKEFSHENLRKIKF